jgi:hypothetical protein
MCLVVLPQTAFTGVPEPRLRYLAFSFRFFRWIARPKPSPVPGNKKQKHRPQFAKARGRVTFRKIRAWKTGKHRERVQASSNDPPFDWASDVFAGSIPNNSTVGTVP